MTETEIYKTSLTKPPRRRRTKVEMSMIEDAMYSIMEEIHRATLRQLFYAMTVRKVIDKSENQYKNTVGRKSVQLREKGVIPFDWFSDHTRWMRKPTTYTSIEQCVTETAKHYRRDLWNKAPVYVEIWLEKDALAGTIIDITQEYDVPLMVARGYSSISFLHSAAQSIAAQEKPVYLYHFGDHDPSGVDAARDIQEKLQRYAPGAEIHFERVAVTPEQITEWDLPSRPTKKTDTRSKNFKGDSVELDAIPPVKLKELVRNVIEQHVDKHALEVMKKAEESERDYLVNWAKYTKSPE